MALRLVLGVALMAVCISMSTAQRPREMPPPDMPPPDMSPPVRPSRGPCRLTDSSDADLDRKDCPDGSTCSDGPIDLFNTDGTTTIKAYFCTPSVIPPRLGLCRVENGGVAVGEERTCPDGATCDVGPQEYKDGDVLLSAYYCRPEDHTARLCGVKAPDDSVAGTRDCSGGLVCDMDKAVETYDNNYSVYGCRRPKPPTEVCRVDSSDGDVVLERSCRDGSQCDTEAFQFVNEGTTYTILYCPRNENSGGMKPPSAGKGGNGPPSGGGGGGNGPPSRGGGGGNGPPSGGGGGGNGPPSGGKGGRFNTGGRGSRRRPQRG